MERDLSLLANLHDSVPVTSCGIIHKLVSTEDNHGWISVDDKGDFWFVLWTSEKCSRSLVFSKECYAVDFRKDTGLPYVRFQDWTGAWESGTGLWPVLKKNQKRADDIFEFIQCCVKFAVEGLARSNAL